MKKRVGCVFMSMLLFFGIAVMGVYAAGKKQDFTPKTITCLLYTSDAADE